MTTPMHPPYAGPGGTAVPPSTQEIPAVGRETRAEDNFAAEYATEQAATYAPGPADGYPRDLHGATAATPAGRPDVEGTSVGELIGEVTRDLSTLMRQELELAKAELTAEAKKAGQGAGMFGAAGFAGYMVLLFLSLAGMWGLSVVIGAGWGGLVIAVLWAAIGAVAYVMGRQRFREVHPKPERTVDTLQQVPGALKPN